MEGQKDQGSMKEGVNWIEHQSQNVYPVWNPSKLSKIAFFADFDEIVDQLKSHLMGLR